MLCTRRVIEEQHECLAYAIAIVQFLIARLAREEHGSILHGSHLHMHISFHVTLYFRC